MGDIFAFRSEIDVVAGKCRADKRSSPGGALRKTLADLTNIHPKPRPSIAESKPDLAPISAKYIDRLSKENEALKKENLALKKQLAERNVTLIKAQSKIAELSATEIQTLRVNLQTLYQQNLQLAQANSQMLGELNSGKDRIKALHHELGCMKGLLNVRTLELQDEKKVVDCQQTSNKVSTIKSEAAGESSQADRATIKHTSAITRRRSKVAGKSAAKDTTDKEKSENKRLCVRRQSSRFKSDEPASTEDLFELDDIRFPMCPQADDTKCGGFGSAPVAFSDNEKHSTVPNSIGSITTETRRTSIGRPLRRAAEKVQSYKEIPLNVKMRRTD